MTNDPINPLTEETEALDRIARTHDGRLFHRYLRRILETAHEFETDGALREQNGRRTLARDLMRLMAPGIEGTSGRRDEQRGDEPILGRAANPVGRGLSRSEQRRQQWATERDAEQPADET